MNNIFGEPYEDDDDDYGFDDEYSHLEDACGSYPCDGFIVCSMAGSEWCEFECPFREELGTELDEECEHGSATFIDGKGWRCDDCGEIVDEDLHSIESPQGN